MDTAQLLLIYSFFVSGFNANVVATLKPTVAPKKAALASGTVRAAAGGASRNVMLVQPANPMTPWYVAGSDGRVTPLDLIGNHPFALNETLAVWVEGSPLNSKFHGRYLTDNRKLVVTADIRAILALTVLDSAAYAIHQQLGVYSLSRVDLTNGIVEKLDEFAAPHELLKFGDCRGKELTLIDPASAEFRVYTLDPVLRKGPWVRINSPLISAIRTGGSAFRAAPAGRVVDKAILAHKRGSGGNHYFLVARGEKGVGQYLLQVDEEGRELARLILEFPSGLKGFGPGFQASLNAEPALSFAHWTGAVITCEGLDY
jgi:hypothetical protein